jgi:hypothetical protein
MNFFRAAILRTKELRPSLMLSTGDGSNSTGVAGAIFVPSVTFMDVVNHFSNLHVGLSGVQRVARPVAR